MYKNNLLVKYTLLAAM